MGARERTGISESQVSEAPGQFQCPAGLVPLPDHKTSDYLPRISQRAVNAAYQT
jgi:hypothetical protein